MKYQSLTNDQLVCHLRAGDANAFEEIYDRFWLKLYGLAYAQLGSREEAEDVIHNLFESIWKKREELDIRNLATYLVVSVKYLSAAYIKSQINLRKFQEYLIFNEILQANDTEDIVNLASLQKAVEEAMKMLPEKTMEVFKMSRFDRKSVRDISQCLHISEKAVEYHITKSLKVMADKLHGFTKAS